MPETFCKYKVFGHFDFRKELCKWALGAQVCAETTQHKIHYKSLLL